MSCHWVERVNILALKDRVSPRQMMKLFESVLRGRIVLPHST